MNLVLFAFLSFQPFLCFIKDLASKRTRPSQKPTTKKKKDILFLPSQKKEASLGEPRRGGCIILYLSCHSSRK